MSKKITVLIEYSVITFGLFINALGWTAFLIPAGIVGGGVTGIGSIIYYATGLPVGVTNLVINFFLVMIAIKFFGASCGVKTIYGIIGQSSLILILQGLFPQPVITDEFMATLIGGTLAGMGIGITFTQGGSTGGTDIIGLIITKYKNISVGKPIFFMNLLIIGSSFFVFGSLEKIIYAYVSLAANAYSIDMITEGRKRSAQIFIVSNHYDRIADRINSELSRGATIMNGTGWYTKEDRNVLMVIARKNEVQQILRIAGQEDPRAFISVGTVMGVYGKGFQGIRM